MNIRKYAYKSFRHTAGKGVMFMIALSVMLLCAVMNIATSLQKTIFEDAVSMAGDAHCKYSNVTSEQVAQLSSQPSVEWSDTYFELEQLLGGVPDSPGTIDLIYSTRLGGTAGFMLTSGRAPKEINEVALPPHVAKLLGVSGKVGERFTMTLRNPGETETITTDFIISGIMQEEPYFEATEVYMLFVSEPFIVEHGHFTEVYYDRTDEAASGYDRRELFVHFKNGFSPQDTAKEIGAAAGIKESNIAFNYQYLNANLQNPMIITIIAVALLILMLAGGIIIYNAFNIIVARKVNQYGLLTLVGASKKQIRSCVYMEALLNAVCAIPIGLVLGTGLSYVVLPFLQGVMGNILNNATLIYHITPWAYCFTILLAFIMVFMGVVRPARKAAKVAPVEAVRFSVATEQYNKRKENKNISLPILARLNMQRNRGRTIGIILSLSISGILFLLVSTVMFSVINNMDNVARNSVVGDIQIEPGKPTTGGYEYDPEADFLNSETIEAIRNIDGVTDAELFYAKNYRIDEAEIDEDGSTSQFGTIAGVDESLFDEILRKTSEGSPSPKDFDDPLSVIAIDTGGYAEDFNHALGQTVTAYLQDSWGKHNGQTVSLKIIGIVSASDIPNYPMNAGTLPSLFMPQKSYEANGLDMLCQSMILSIDSEKHDLITKALDEICAQNGHIHYKSFIELTREYQRQLIGIVSLIMSVLAIVALVGILNLVSSTLIGIQQRQREFGLLSALGLSPKGLRKLLRYEGLLISCLSITLSSIVGILSGYGILQALQMQFTFPFIPVLIICLVFGIVPYCITHIAMKRLNKNTIVTLLGQEV